MLRSISIVVVAAVVLVIGLVLQLKPFFIHNENVTEWQHATPLCYGSGSMALVMLVVDSLQFQFYSWFLHVNLCVSVYVCIYASIYIVKFPIFLYIIWFWETHCLFQSICCFCVRYFIYIFCFSVWISLICFLLLCAIYFLFCFWWHVFVVYTIAISADLFVANKTLQRLLFVVILYCCCCCCGPSFFVFVEFLIIILHTKNESKQWFFIHGCQVILLIVFN